MTDPTISQDAREAASMLIRKLQYPTEYLSEIEDGSYDDNYFVQAFARFEAHLRTPATPIEALQQRVERLEVATKGLLQACTRLDAYDRWMCEEELTEAREALGDDVG